MPSTMTERLRKKMRGMRSERKDDCTLLKVTELLTVNVVTIYHVLNELGFVQT